MFASLARRLTGWYVFVAVALVVMIAVSLTVGGLLFYAHGVNEQIDAVSRQIPDIEVRATTDHESWTAAVALLDRRLSRPGVIIRALPPPPGAPLPKTGEFGIVRIADHDRAHTSRDSNAQPPRSIGQRPENNRVGYAAGTFLGIRVERQPFMGGLVSVYADGTRVQQVVEVALLAVIVTGLLAGLAAWTIGRYITSQALRPLYDVTAALQRFAARDFTAQSIDIAGRNEFDELVGAYNAAAAQVEVAFAERQAAEAQMRQFVADAGHELRTPLTIVLGYIDMLKKRASDDNRSRRIFETIAIEGSRMRTLIDNLVLLARLEGKDARPVEPFDLTRLVECDIVETRRVIAPNVRFDVDIMVDATIIGDRAEIYEALANVVDNAIKYAPGSPVEIRVRPSGGAVEIAISDRGPGIDDADRGAIFDRFYRGSLRGEVEGSGLGLAIAKRAIERAGGTLTLARTSAQGTTFTFVLRADQIAVRTASRPAN